MYQVQSKLQDPQLKPYLISERNKALLDVVDRWTASGRIVNVLVTGRQGCGKSELVTQFAATRKRPLAVLEVGRLSESSQIFGHMVLDGNRTVYRPGLFTEAIATPGCVVHLQELNRPENDKALNALFSVLDDTQRRVWVDEAGGYIQVAKGVTFFATLNEGYEFIGTMPVDVALRNRFHIKINLGYLPADVESAIVRIRTGLVDEEKCNGLVYHINQLRRNTIRPMHISTRDTINIASLMAEGIPEDAALRAVIGGSDEKFEQVLLSLHLSGTDTSVTENDKYVPL